MTKRTLLHTFKLAFLLLSASGAGIVDAANLIRDPDVNASPLSCEFCLFGSPEQGRIESFEEGATWNRCAKLELLRCGVDAKGVTNVCVGLEVGGDGGRRKGFAVRGGAKYRFSFEMRGDAPTVIVVQRTWDKNGKVTQKATPMNTVKPQKDWTAYKGEFEAPADAVRGTLLFQFWGRMPRYVDVCRPPYHILVDKISVEEVTFGRDIWPATVIVVPEGGTAEHEGFRSLEISDRPAILPARMSVRAAEDALKFRFAFDGAAPAPNTSGTGLWTHDLVELCFVRQGPGTPPLHLGVNAAGVKWMADNDPDYSLWEAKADIRPNGWDAAVSVSWKALGFASKPPKGTQIRFNAMREHTVGRGDKPDPAKANRCGRGWMLDNSVFSFAGTEFGNPDRFGVLIIGDDPRYGNDPTAWWQEEERRREDARLAELMRRKTIVAQVPMHTDPAIPYLPPELYEPQAVFRVRAAVNERTSLPIAVANMTDAMEEYRVTLLRGFLPPMPTFEHPMPLVGLTNAAGRTIGPKKITMRRGVRFRDANAKGHGARYDILAKMDEVSSIPVPPKEAGLVWIHLDCHGVEPGIYRGELVVTPLAGGMFGGITMKRMPDGTKSMVIADDSTIVPVELEVLPFELAEPTDFALQAFRTGWRDYQIGFMNEYDCIGFMVTPWFFDMAFNPDGSVKAARPRSFLVPHLRELHRFAKKQGRHPRVMIAYSCYHVFKKFHMRDSGIGFGTPEYWTAWRNWLKYVENTMNENGFPDDDYVMEVYDEPNPKEWPMEEVVRSYREARAAVPKMQLLNTNGERIYFREVSPFVDHWCFSQHAFGLNGIMDYPKEMTADGKTVSMYACGTNMRQDLYRYYRILAWKAANIGSDFVSIYQFYDQQPGCSFRQATFGAVAYDTSYEAVPSIRLENLYAGMTDIRYLRLLERKARAAGGTPEAKAALAFAAKALYDVPVKHPHDDTGASRFRAECIEHLLKLLGHEKQQRKERK